MLASKIMSAIVQDQATDQAERRLFVQDDLAIQQQWFVDGKHYSRTLEAWLDKMDAQKTSIMPIFQVLSKPEASWHHLIVMNEALMHQRSGRHACR